MKKKNKEKKRREKKQFLRGIDGIDGRYEFAARYDPRARRDFKLTSLGALRLASQRINSQVLLLYDIVYILFRNQFFVLSLRSPRFHIDWTTQA